jgi:hypothetical protein
MSKRESSAVASRWIRKHLSTMDHNFYSVVPEKFYLDTLIVSQLNQYFRDNDMGYFKSCFQVFSGASSKIPAGAAEEIQRSVKIMHDIVHGRFVLRYDPFLTTTRYYGAGSANNSICAVYCDECMLYICVCVLCCVVLVSEVGLETVRQKHLQGAYGRCPRLHCQEHSLLPLGMHDIPGVSQAHCFCPKCRDMYLSPRHVTIDSVAFGTSLPHLLLDQYPDLCPTKPTTVYVPKLFGFAIHSSAPVLRKYCEGESESESNDERKPKKPDANEEERRRNEISMCKDVR